MTATTAQTIDTGARDRILVCVAWPYANGPFHVGHVSGVYLPADIFARFSRARGADVIMVSGSDCHGAPITIRAEREGVTPLAIIDRYHTAFIHTFDQLGIAFDLFTRTYTENHYAVTQDVFLRLLDEGYLYRDRMIRLLQRDAGALPARPLRGGDLPDLRLHPRARRSVRQLRHAARPRTARQPVQRDRSRPDHLPRDGARLPRPRQIRTGPPRLARRHRPPTTGANNTVAFTRNWLREGLHGRAITRDLDWGVPVPLPDEVFKDKRIYVWFDAVIGYLSASKEWAANEGQPEAWQRWWDAADPAAAEARAYYFLGKDNIPFHTIIWPAMLIGYGGLNLPYDVPAAEFMNLEGEQMSTSRNWAVWLPDIEDRYQPDAIRYYLTALAPETRDSNWSWADFVTRINSELVATWGNLVNRVLSFTYKNFDGRVPQPGELTARDYALLAARDAAFARVTDLLAGVHLRDALKEALAFAGATNRYLDETAPWKALKTDREAAGRALFVAIQAINALKVLTTPFLPFSAEKIHSLLGFDEGDTTKGTWSGHAAGGRIETPATARWAIEAVPADQPLRQPEPLFIKLDPKTADEELARLQAATVAKG